MYFELDFDKQDKYILMGKKKSLVLENKLSFKIFLIILFDSELHIKDQISVFFHMQVMLCL